MLDELNDVQRKFGFVILLVSKIDDHSIDST